MTSKYALSAWDDAVALYERSNTTGVPLHRRPPHIIEAWRKAAEIAKARALNEVGL